MMSDDGHSNMRAILPSLPRDLKDGLGDFLFLVGLRKSRPPAGKYDWIEKFEYFAVVWGTIVMVVSGLALWFADAILRVAPLWVIDVAKVVHRYEAILAILSVVVWHMYTVHFRPGVFPMSRVWLDGRISRSQMIHHHPLEYERLTGRTAGGHGEGAGEVRS
jgi:cytochrome b subunit of formate dehydrogenase